MMFIHFLARNEVAHALPWETPASAQMTGRRAEFLATVWPGMACLHGRTGTFSRRPKVLGASAHAHHMIHAILQRYER